MPLAKRLMIVSVALASLLVTAAAVLARDGGGAARGQSLGGRDGRAALVPPARSDDFAVRSMGRAGAWSSMNRGGQSFGMQRSGAGFHQQRSFNRFDSGRFGRSGSDFHGHRFHDHNFGHSHSHFVSPGSAFYYGSWYPYYGYPYYSYPYYRYRSYYYPYYPYYGYNGYYPPYYASSYVIYGSGNYAVPSDASAAGTPGYADNAAGGGEQAPRTVEPLSLARVSGILEATAETPARSGRPAMTMLRLRDAAGNLRDVELGDADLVRQALPALKSGQRFDVWGTYPQGASDRPLQARGVTIDGSSFTLPVYEFDQALEGVIVQPATSAGPGAAATVRVRLANGGMMDVQVPPGTGDLVPGWRLAVQGYVRMLDNERLFIAQQLRMSPPPQESAVAPQFIPAPATQPSTN